MKHYWLFLVFLLACLPPEPHGLAGLIVPESQMPRWAAPPINLVLSANEAALGSDLTITAGPADYAWGIAYVYTDHKIWEKVIINPLMTKDSIVQQWVKGTAVFTLPITSVKFTPGKTYYVIGYWCNKKIKWDCNGNKWMLISFKVKKTAPPIDEELNNLTNELDNIEKELQTTEETDVLSSIDQLDWGP